MGELTPELRALQSEIEAYAADYGLDCFEIVYELLDCDELNEVAAYGGLPSRYPHWRFGMEYQYLNTSYSWGLSKIYELVINNDPCYAYLMKNNAIVDQKLVMAHVCGHCDFFKNNLWFSHTNRKMVDEMANHGTRIRRYIERHGLDRVEEFIDCCLSLENLIDIYGPFIKREGAVEPHPDELAEEDSTVTETSPRLNREYLDRYINPPSKIVEEQRELQARQLEKRERFPSNPQKDILLFLLNYAPLETWERDVLSIIREEAYYFAPQGQTKIINEGWASFWHSTIMTRKALKASEVVDFADHHAGTMGVQPGRINPYKLGLELLRDIEERWNRGQFGKEWEECDDIEEKKRWDTGAMLGREKLFEVRRVYNDVGFIDAFLTPEFCRDQNMFTFTHNARSGNYVIDSREFAKIKAQLLFGLANHGQPFIEVTDANYENRGELYLHHNYEGIELFLADTRDTLRQLQRIWRRPVHLETVLSGDAIRLSYDGKAHRQTNLGETEIEEVELELE